MFSKMSCVCRGERRPAQGEWEGSPGWSLTYVLMLSSHSPGSKVGPLSNSTRLLKVSWPLLALGSPSALTGLSDRTSPVPFSGSIPFPKLCSHQHKQPLCPAYALVTRLK